MRRFAEILKSGGFIALAVLSIVVVVLVAVFGVIEYTPVGQPSQVIENLCSGVSYITLK